MPSESISITWSNAGALQRAVAPGAAHEREEVVLGEIFARAGSHDLLRQNVERVARKLNAVEFAAMDGAHQGGAFHQFVARGGEQAALGQRAHPVASAAHALQRHRDGPRRADLADQIDRADIDTQFERGGGHHGAQFAIFETLLGIQAQRARQAAMVRQDGVFAQAFGQMVGHALGQAARIDEDERGAVGADELGRAVVDLVPHFVGGDGAEFVARHLHRQFHGATMAHVDRVRALAQKRRDIFQRLHRSGESDALRCGTTVLLHQAVEPRQGQSQVSAALVVGDGMDLVHDHGADAGQHLAGLDGSEQNEQGLGRGDQDVRPAARHPLALPLRRVAGPQGRSDGRQYDAALARQSGNLGQRDFEILMNVVAQRLERRDVDDLGPVGQRTQAGAAHQAVDGGEEGGERFAGARGRGDEDIVALGDFRPSAQLRFGGLAKARGEPFCDEGVETGEH